MSKNHFFATLIALMALILPSSYAVSSSELENIVMGEIQGKIESDYGVKFLFVGESVTKESEEYVTPTPTPKKEVKKKTPGQLKIEAMLQKNRDILAKRATKKRAAEKSKSSLPSSSPSNSSDWMDSKMKQMDKWVSEKQKLMDQWVESKKAYKKALPKLKEDLTDLDKVVVKPVIEKKPVPIKVKKVEVIEGKLNKYLLKETFELPVRSQGRRPTCASFAGVRAMEILLARQGSVSDLSEQYFYYASKPYCQRSPCSKKGSWPTPAIDRPIPLERQCPYSDRPRGGNETQIPLPSSCNRGSAKISSYAYAKTREEIQQAIRDGYPVVGGFKLDDAFFDSEGYVFAKSGKEISLRDAHAQGHALVMVGVIDLPEKLWATQGKHCNLVVNSWGEGWGLGGYGCLSDKWIDQYRFSFPFLVVKGVQRL